MRGRKSAGRGAVRCEDAVAGVALRAGGFSLPSPSNGSTSSTSDEDPARAVPGRPKGEGDAVPDVNADDGGPVAARLTHDKALLLLYGALAARGRRRLVRDGEEDIL